MRSHWAILVSGQGHNIPTNWGSVAWRGPLRRSLRKFNARR